MRYALLCAIGFMLIAANPAQADCFPKFGTDGPDVITANPECVAGQKLIGLGGDDILTGGVGDDVLWGDACNADTTGGDCTNGSDILTGGGGSDAFGFNRASESRGDRIDTIMDFTHGDDLIAMAGVLYHAGKLTGHFIGPSPFDGVPGEVNYRVAYLPRRKTPSQRSGQAVTIVSADLDGDMRPDFQVYLIGDIVLTAADFLFDSYPPQ